MDEEPDVTEVIQAVERLRKNYRKPLPIRTPEHQEQTTTEPHAANKQQQQS